MYVHMCYVCMCMCVYVRICVGCVHVCACVYVFVCMYAYVCVRAHTLPHAQRQASTLPQCGHSPVIHSPRTCAQISSAHFSHSKSPTY